MFSPMALQQMWARAWPIILLLAGCSVLSAAIMLERWKSLSRAAFRRDVLLKKLQGLLDAHQLEEAAGHCEGLHKPVGKVLAALLEFARHNRSADRERLDRLAGRLIRAEIAELSHNLTVLGTIGSISPFVGLLGTVVGIIHAFRAISENAGGGPGVVANGIAEALITTALGLFVAIPAVVGYNLYIRKLERISEDMQLVVDEVVDWLAPR
jgi:biopolymer transport protein ExbB/biopolymer transport protein TolQ